MAQGYQAEFMVGAATPKQYPVEDLPEAAFVGRSNVGKSSLLNRLVNQRKLARVSRTPGCTQQINFFHVQRRWLFADLPGYGYARVSRSQRSGWDRNLSRYLSSRRNLRAVVLLLDLRRGLTDLDREMAAFLDAGGVPFIPVATKVDKLKGNARRKALADLEKAVAEASAFAICAPVSCSAHTGAGIDALRDLLAQVLGDDAERPAENRITGEKGPAEQARKGIPAPSKARDR